MAKTTKGKGKKKSKGQKKQPSETQDKDPSPPTKKPAKFECQHCGKVIGNAHNLKVHEHNCKFKAVEKDRKAMDREMGSALRKMKDEFEDQRDLFQKESLEREKLLKKELDELKETLRLEIKMGHHGHDPAPPQKEEDSLTPVVEEKADDVQIAEPLPEPEPVIEPPREVVKEPEPEPQPPSYSPPPQAAPSPAPATLPPQEVATPIEPIPVSPAPSVLETVEVSLPVQPELTEVQATPSISRDMVLELLKEEMGKLADVKGDVSGYVVPADITERLEKMENKLTSLSSDIPQIAKDSRRAIDEIERSVDKKLADINLKRIDREIEKISERVFDIMDEVGFGESLNVAKIPPNILEIVYKATLEDVVRELTRSLGEQEAERKINTALEEVRMKTSGSELFSYNGRSIITENLARSLETNMISAKQIQTTYSELLRNLLTKVPYYKSKNFQAMIKIKSQEYAVDRATVLSSDVETIRTNMNNMGQMIAAFSSQLSAKAMQLEGDIKENQEILGSKSDKADMENILSGMMERAEAERALSEKFTNLMNDMDALKGLVDNISKTPDETSTEKADEPEAKELPESEPDQEDGKKEKKPIKPKTEIEPDKETKKPKTPGTMVLDDDEPQTDPKVSSTMPDDNEKKVMDALEAGNSSKTAIQKASRLGKKEVEETLASFVRSKSVIKKGPKNRPVYSVVDVKKEKKKPSPKKKDASDEKPAEKAAKPDDNKKKSGAKKKTATKTVKKGKEEPEKKGEPKAEKAKDKKPEAAKKEKKPSPKAKAEDKKPEKEKKPKKEKKVDEPQKEAKKDDEAEAKAEPAPPSKTVAELDESEKKVYDAIPEKGITLPNLKKQVAKDIKYTVVLRALRVLLDNDIVEAVTKGRNTLYQKINVKKTDETGRKEIKQEVK